LRSVSNYIAERDKKKWDMKTSIINLNKELIKLVEMVNKEFRIKESRIEE
jgi:futalosine hydrolase